MCCSVLGLLHFPVNFRISFSTFTKNKKQNILELWLGLYCILNMQINLRIDNFAILTLLTHKQAISLHLFRSSLISLSNNFQFFTYWSCTSCVRFIPKYLILFWCYYKWLFSFFFFLVEVNSKYLRLCGPHIVIVPYSFFKKNFYNVERILWTFFIKVGLTINKSDSLLQTIM